jgi:hypothetical protein
MIIPADELQLNHSYNQVVDHQVMMMVMMMMTRVKLMAAFIVTPTTTNPRGLEALLPQYLNMT